MSQAGGGAATGQSRGRVTLWVLLIGSLLLVAVLLLGTPPRDDPLDPRSHEPTGTSALVALLDELGAEVSVDPTLPTGDSGTDGEGGDGEAAEEVDVALVLWDRFDERGRQDLWRWVEQGGTLVVADPESTLAPLPDDPNGNDLEEELARQEGERIDYQGPEETIAKGRCDVLPLDDPDIHGLAIQGWPVRYPVHGETQSCFGSSAGAFVVATPQGEGTQVALGGAGILTNQALDQADNAPVVAALLAPEAGTRVVVLDPTARPAGGEDSLWEIVPIGFKRALVQLGVAFAIFVLWRIRRLGRPVAEPQPVKVASSELVSAVGGLLQRAGSPQHAADTLRADLRRDLVRRLGLSPNMPPDSFLRTVEARCPPALVESGRLGLALGPGPVTSDQELLRVAQSIDVVREEVLENVGTAV